MAYDFNPDSMMLHEKAALVTGGGTGIGAAIAVALARCGADVAVTYNAHVPTATGAAIEAAGRGFEAIQSDFSALDTTSAQSFVDRTRNRFGRFDILVNNAGIIRRAPAAEFTDIDWRDVLHINLDAAFYLSQAAGRHFLEQKKAASSTWRRCSVSRAG